MTTANVSAVIEATATLRGKEWAIDIPELGTGGQASTVRQIDEIATEVAALWLHCSPGDVDVNVTLQVPDESRAVWKSAQELCELARVAASEASVLRKQAVQALREQGFTLAAVARAFDISPQRAHQLTR
ncbi:hypothetical protein JF66_00450 [Cryobacterium sp. MLB-32]|uniref:hypothetical protein n=1 Tax=Cryobacterium sp. MLB-32 TaxID=1529318 RepID=UPI0004E6E142|nr:hypothetical protein [Cryobacterium sp. MLB-32]KFF60988.1 hypothetical protein JF66_00450 [Cryobacterium sp. MLB-32]